MRRGRNGRGAPGIGPLLEYPANMDERTVLSQVLLATERNSVLAGQELRQAARALTLRVATDELSVLGVGEAGERIIGAALVDHALHLVDRSRRVDGRSILIVSGYMAGPYDIASMATALWSMGAAHVHAALIGPDLGPIPGCETVTSLDQRSRATLIA